MILLLAVLLAVYVLPPPWDAVAVAAGIVLEVGEVVALRAWSRRIGRRTAPTTGAEALIGRSAEVVDPCTPRGTVRLDGVLWEATCETGADRGDDVTVRAVDRLRLTVTRA